ncbi:MAG: PilZ domain-containing protein [Planctomycetota bacterium]
MSEDTERRSEQRLHYQWPVWFAEDYNGMLSQGQMVDISSNGAAFTCYADDSCPYPGQHITARFSVPHLGPDDSFDMESYIRAGNICRVEEVSRFVRRVAIQFAEPLPFKPGEQARNEADTRERLKFTTI